MKIKIISQPYLEALAESNERRGKHKKPKKPNMLFRTLMRVLAIPDMIATHFHANKVGMDRLKKGEPAFYLMNHSSFIDLEIVPTLLYPKPFNIVATTDAFIGKEWLMRQIGCIPTKKFVPDVTLIRDIMYATKTLHDSVVMFPEAGYSFDGTATVLPDTVGKFVKLLGIPLVMISTYGAFTRDPLYNNLHKRKVRVSATMKYLLSADEIKEKSAEEISALIAKHFCFDSFRWQQEKNIHITEKNRAEGLERILYKCPHCNTECRMLGEGDHVSCLECGKVYYLGETGLLECRCEDEDCKCEIPHIPDWYAWEREEVKREISEGRYSLDIPVKIVVSFDTSKFYEVGEGRLTHNSEGLHVTSNDGNIDYLHKPLASYTICSDFNFYEIGDVISFGDTSCLYYCFPLCEGVSVAKVRIAAEEMYKLERARVDAEAAERAAGEKEQKSTD